MPLVEIVGQMQREGLKEEEIIQRLREVGISPKEIREAMDQNNVKIAVVKGEGMEPSLMSSADTSTPFMLPGQERREGKFNQQTEQPAQEMPPAPQFPEASRQEQYITQELPAPGQEAEGYYPTEQPYAGSQYAEYQAPAQPMNTEMITEIAGQITEEKTQEIQKQISDISRFKIEAQGKISNIEERLRRIEVIIDRLQISILREIGNYGKNISELKEEMQATQGSFSKILEPLSENIQELRKITGAVPRAARPGEPAKVEDKVPAKSEQPRNKDNFERYMRA